MFILSFHKSALVIFLIVDAKMYFKVQKFIA